MELPFTGRSKEVKWYDITLCIIDERAQGA